MSIYGFFKRHKNGRHGSTVRDISSYSARRRQADTDRSRIGMLEERMANQQNGTWLSGSRAAQESYGNSLIQVAKDCGLFMTHDECRALGRKKLLPSGESAIYENAQQGIVYKVRDPFAKLHLKSANLNSILYEHIIHNLLFPETAYSFVGISEVAGNLRIVLSQKFVFETHVPTQEQVEKYLAGLGLMPEERYYYGNEYLAITDVNSTGDNVLLSAEGRLLFIDPIIKLKRPADEIIEYLLRQ